MRLPEISGAASPCSSRHSKMPVACFWWWVYGRGRLMSATADLSRRTPGTIRLCRSIQFGKVAPLGTSLSSRPKDCVVAIGLEAIGLRISFLALNLQPPELRHSQKSEAMASAILTSGAELLSLRPPSDPAPRGARQPVTERAGRSYPSQGTSSRCAAAMPSAMRAASLPTPPMSIEPMDRWNLRPTKWSPDSSGTVPWLSTG